MSRLPSAPTRRADSALHPILASQRRLAEVRHGAALILLLVAGTLIGFAAGTAAMLAARRVAGLFLLVLEVLP